MKIEISVDVNATLAEVWQAWTTPESIVNWNFASPEWCCPNAEIDLQVGGKFSYRMEAKDGSVGFDFWGVFTKVESPNELNITLGDDRTVTVSFFETDQSVRVVETFEAESENSAEQQKQGWQSILNSFKSYVESN